MALHSRCPKEGCNSTRFESELEEPEGSKFKLLFIRCYSCGTVVGVLDYYNIGAMLTKLGQKLGFDLR